VVAEPGAAAALAGYELAAARGQVSPGQLTVIVVTGHGLKDIGALAGAVEEEAALEPGDEAAAGVLLEASARG
jgi:threonine synthase